MKAWRCIATLGMLCAAAAGAQEMRTLKYRTGPEAAARAWQSTVRVKLRELMRMDDLEAARSSVPLDAELMPEHQEQDYRWQEVSLRSTSARRIQVVVARPLEPTNERLPAVVCIPGHGGTRLTPFDPEVGIYKRFGVELARRGFVVISADVGQHDVYESGRTLMGERLWDLTRCVDYLRTLPEVDPARIGCAGLSLGGEMAMWLGAMDERIAATVSCGFLTMMGQMEQNHCMCWKFDGLRALVDFPDIYSLIAPRPLQCQNGLKEPDTQFTVPLARKALAEIEPIYLDLGAPDKVMLVAHEGAHEIAFRPMHAFLRQYLIPAGK